MSIYRNETRVFMARYRRFHSRVSGHTSDPTYGGSLFFRWVVLRWAVELWNSQQHSPRPIERIVALDPDSVLLTTNPATLFNNAIAAVAASSSSPSPSSFVTLGGGAVALFQSQGALVDFSEYILDFYFNQPDSKIRFAHSLYGRHWTDAMMAREFKKASLCFDYHQTQPFAGSNSSGAGYKSWKTLPHNQCLLQRLGCIPMAPSVKSNSLAVHRPDGSVLETTLDCTAKTPSWPLLLKSPEETLPYCFLNHQGREQYKQVLLIYMRAATGCAAANNK